MKLHDRTLFQALACGVFVATAALAVASSRDAQASEAKGDLNLELRLVEVVPGPSGQSGVARIELAIDAFRATRELALSIERADGTPWTFKGHPVTPRTSTSPGGEPWEPGADGLTVPALGTRRALIEVPLDGVAVHEIIVRATGISATGAVSTEAMIKAALGTIPNLPVDDGTTANFSLGGVR